MEIVNVRVTEITAEQLREAVLTKTCLTVDMGTGTRFCVVCPGDRHKEIDRLEAVIKQLLELSKIDPNNLAQHLLKERES